MTKKLWLAKEARGSQYRLAVTSVVSTELVILYTRSLQSREVSFREVSVIMEVPLKFMVRCIYDIDCQQSLCPEWKQAF